ncbi:unnamed protein product [Spodoptera littoralis]|uniref:Claspin n=1 Tax=Spodoptera littoralis TaxID=7109 RepID=A0A9P0HYB0_SPOLI|nr:unnamed protein product [Spodoptera littoralis]CAH1637704.1 unnamed protein product [Spodoptera littoralis]
MLSRRGSSDMESLNIAEKTLNSLNSSDDEGGPIQRTKKRIQNFSDSDTEKENLEVNIQDGIQPSESDSESETVPIKSGKIKSRIHMDISSDSDTSNKHGSVKNEGQQIRMKNKRNKLKDKFKSLLNSREKHTLQENSSNESEGSHNAVSDASDEEMSSISKIKQKIKKSMATVSSICDPDTSDEEATTNAKPKQKPKKQKSTKLIEPKPVRMSAKQAMENMQLIKSESNRMLREKAVSLPYHRPKALSLKDIMSRRKPAVASDGKALPIKMNEEQLKHYASLLEQRQKEMMELCKSESDEETPDTEEKSKNTEQETEKPSDIAKPEDEIPTEKCDTNVLVQNLDNDLPAVMNDNIDAEKIVEEIATNIISPEGDAEGGTANNDHDNENTNEPNDEQNSSVKDDSNTDFKLVYNDSVEEEQIKLDEKESTDITNKEATDQVNVPENNVENYNDSELQTKGNTEEESQLISLHYTENNTEQIDENMEKPEADVVTESKDNDGYEQSNEVVNEDFFSDDDVNMEDIDKLIENAEILRDDDNISYPMLVKDPPNLNAKPKLTGAPGMVIDLDGGSVMSKKTGVELLKERFTYFAKLKTPEELEREKEKRIKPGAQHLKLKQELEEQIAEQRSLEWAKRLEEEKQQHMEMDTILDDADADDSIEKIEEKLEETEAEKEGEISESEEEEELEENDIEMKDKPRKHNPMVDEEAEESDCDEEDEGIAKDDENNDEVDDDGGQEDDGDDESSEEESSESEEEEETSKPRKGRILKAFEDSDDEDVTIKEKETKESVSDTEKVVESKINDDQALVETNNADGVAETNNTDLAETPIEGGSSSQDDVIQLAQRHQSVSDDVFTSQESTLIDQTKDGNNVGDEVLGTQTFSILETTTSGLHSPSKLNIDVELQSPSKLNILCMSQPYHDPSIDGIVEGSQLPISQTSQSQPLGEDVLALCTGKFYDNEFVSPTEENQYVDDFTQQLSLDKIGDTQLDKTANGVLNRDNELGIDKESATIEDQNMNKEDSPKPDEPDGNLLKSILDELHDPEFDKPKENKFFTGGTQKKDSAKVLENTQMKKKFVIDSDDEAAEANVDSEQAKKKKLKKKRPEKRALQISDDEEEEEEKQMEDDDMSDLEEDNERLVEYDSEENEIEVKIDKPKKKRKVTDFFEQEAELTSEDEWVGSGDEDEKGLDRMEREEGDDEVFHQGKLRKELGQIHMRDVLDQDKREVRLIQELLFEDGDLGDGHRQRKFRWRNAGDDDDAGTVPDEFADTQEEEFESEEQWRKQRHEREVYLRQMQQQEEESSLNVSVNRTTIIKANLLSKSMSTLLQEVNQTKTEATEVTVVQEKKTAKDIPSPKKSYSIFQQSYHGSLLTRGQGALARLAALATPLATDDDSPKIGSLATHKRNFVFTSITPGEDDVPKVTIKRKADAPQGTPKLMKKLKIEEKTVHTKSSLLDHLKL